jgi:ribosomal protein S8
MNPKKTYDEFISDLNAETNKRKIVLLVRLYRKDRANVISRIQEIRVEERKLYDEVQEILKLRLEGKNNFEELAAAKIGRSEIENEPLLF